MRVSRGLGGLLGVTNLTLTGGSGKLPWGLKHWGGYLDDIGVAGVC